MRDVLEVIAMLGCFIVPFAMFQQWAWMAFFIVIGVVFGLAEGYFALIHKDKKTLTRRFREFSGEHKTKGSICLVFLALGWGILLMHLGRREEQ